MKACTVDRPDLARSVASRNRVPCFRSGSRWQPSAHSFQALIKTNRSCPGKSRWVTRMDSASHRS